MSAKCINSSRLSVVPTAKREELPLNVSTSSWVMVMDSDMGNWASAMTKPVINLVMDAMGNTAASFLLNNTSLVS